MFRPWHRYACRPIVADDDDAAWSHFIAALEHRELSRGALARRLGVPRWQLEEEAHAGAWDARLAAFDSSIAHAVDDTAHRVARFALDLVSLGLAAHAEAGGVGLTPRDLLALVDLAQRLEPKKGPESGPSAPVDVSSLTDEELDLLSRAQALEKKLTPC